MVRFDLAIRLCMLSQYWANDCRRAISRDIWPIESLCSELQARAKQRGDTVVRGMLVPIEQGQ